MIVNLIILSNSTMLNSISEVANIVVALGLVIAAFTYYSSRKGNYLQTIESCSQEYRKYMRKIQKGEVDDILKHDILGLFHKQLFYIKNNYVPKDIKIEWLVTMRSILIEKKYSKDRLSFCKKDCKKEFPRVKDFIELNENEYSTSDSKKKTKNLKKAYKKYYFTLIERICLNSNKQWRNAFDINDKHK